MYSGGIAQMCFGIYTIIDILVKIQRMEESTLSVHVESVLKYFTSEDNRIFM